MAAPCQEITSRFSVKLVGLADGSVCDNRISQRTTETDQKSQGHISVLHQFWGYIGRTPSGLSIPVPGVYTTNARTLSDIILSTRQIDPECETQCCQSILLVSPGAGCSVDTWPRMTESLSGFSWSDINLCVWRFNHSFFFHFYVIINWGLSCPLNKMKSGSYPWIR